MGLLRRKPNFPTGWIPAQDRRGNDGKKPMRMTGKGDETAGRGKKRADASPGLTRLAGALLPVISAVILGGDPVR